MNLALMDKDFNIVKYISFINLQWIGDIMNRENLMFSCRPVNMTAVQSIYSRKTDQKWD
ncbi:MAG: hypothetical protein V8S42_07380 [Lachnospiraceae bacterium]